MPMSMTLGHGYFTKNDESDCHSLYRGGNLKMQWEDGVAYQIQTGLTAVWLSL